MKNGAVFGQSMEKDFFPQDYERVTPNYEWSTRYIVLKKTFDLGFSLLAMPIICVMSLILLVLNPLFNPGPLFFCQERMGYGGAKFWIWKFRSMTAGGAMIRDHDAPLETYRIRRLGRFLRRSRIDELPNVVNIVRGEMSLVGPRPETWAHALRFIEDVPLYRDRFCVLPGITGLAQVRGGYADNPRAVQRKARFDLFYVRRSRFKLDLYIIGQTIKVVLTGFGAK